MNRILQISAGDLDATMEAGVTHKQLNELAIDPGNLMNPGKILRVRISEA